MGALRGKLLVAHPKLAERAFSRSVVLMAAHDDDGALGLILNRPTQMGVGDVAPPVAVLPSDGLIHEGGPVEPDGLVVLAEFRTDAGAHVTIDRSLGLLRSDAGSPDEVAPSIERCRIFAGHAGWAPGQLEAELAEQAWLVTERRVAEDDDVFGDDPATLWNRVLERLGGSFSKLAHPPENPNLN